MRSARLCFYEEGSEEPLSFRDVILRSRSLEHLVNSYVATPSVRRRMRRHSRHVDLLLG